MRLGALEVSFAEMNMYTYIYIYLFSLLGFKGNLSLLDILLLFPGAYSQMEA